MQLGMIGLGRMGANMVRRLHGAAATSASSTTSTPRRRPRWSKEGAVAGDDARGVRRASCKPPRAVWLMVPAAVVDTTLDKLAASSRRATS